jgi:hypothetical protein
VGGATDLRHEYSRDYLFGVLQSDIMPLVDGISIHPMYGSSPQFDEVRQYYYDYPSMLQEIKDVSSAHGFSGEYFAEEMSWRTASNPNPNEPGEYSSAEAAQYYARGILTNLGMEFWAGIGGERYDEIPPVVAVVQNLAATMAGAEAESLSLTIESEATNIVNYGFRVDDRTKLVALWTDGAAVDDDPGVPTSITVTGFAEWQASAIDVLHGFEQPLATSNEDGDLMITGLLVKDHPIIIRLSK